MHKSSGCTSPWLYNAVSISEASLHAWLRKFCPPINESQTPLSTISWQRADKVKWTSRSMNAILASENRMHRNSCLPECRKKASPQKRNIVVLLFNAQARSPVIFSPSWSRFDGLWACGYENSYGIASWYSSFDLWIIIRGQNLASFEINVHGNPLVLLHHWVSCHRSFYKKYSTIKPF